MSDSNQRPCDPESEGSVASSSNPDASAVPVPVDTSLPSAQDSEADLPEDMVVIGAGIDFTDPNSPLAPLYLRSTDVAAVAFLTLVFSAITLFFPIFRTDIWAHLRFGEEIVQGRWPLHEPFPETYADKQPPYIHYQWLVQAGGYLIYSAGQKLALADPDHQLAAGALLLTTVQALIVVLRLLILYLAFKRLTGSPPVALAGIILVASMGLVVHLYIIRPQIVGELAFAAVLFALSRPILSRRALVAVPLVFLLWANCHGSFPLGFALLGACCVGRMLQVAWDGWHTMPSPSSRLQAAWSAVWKDTALRRLSLVTLLSVIATFVNPHGPFLLIESFQLSKNPNIASMVEWRSLPYTASAHFVMLGSVLLLAWLLRASPRSLGPTAVLLLLGFGIESVAHARYVVWWTTLFPWVIVPHLHAALQRRHLNWLDDPSVPSLRKTALGVLLVLALLCWSRPAFWLLYGDAPLPKDRVEATTPVALARTLRHVEGAKQRVVFSSETLGDYLLWDVRRGSEMKISCYTHVHLFTPEHWHKCEVVKNTQPGWREILENDFDADYVVLEYDLFEQEQHRKDGKSPGMFKLIDEIKALPDHWRVISADKDPIFFAERVR